MVLVAQRLERGPVESRVGVIPEVLSVADKGSEGSQGRGNQSVGGYSYVLLTLLNSLYIIQCRAKASQSVLELCRSLTEYKMLLLLTSEVSFVLEDVTSSLVELDVVEDAVGEVFTSHVCVCSTNEEAKCRVVVELVGGWMNVLIDQFIVEIQRQAFHCVPRHIHLSPTTTTCVVFIVDTLWDPSSSSPNCQLVNLTFDLLI